MNILLALKILKSLRNLKKILEDGHISKEEFNRLIEQLLEDL